MATIDEHTPLIARDREENEVMESSPLLQDHDDHRGEINANGNGNGNDGTPPKPKTWGLWSRSSKDTTSVEAKSNWRWPSIIAIAVLAILVILIIFLGFIVPPAIQKYVENAAVLEPTNLSIENITADGIWARVQANVRLEGSRVEDTNSRRIGKAVTGIMQKLETGETTVDVFLPDYEDALAGTAVIPPLVLDIVNGHNTELDFVTKIEPGAAEDIRKIANDWLLGRLDQLRVVGKTKIQLKSGIFPLGTHNVAETLVFEANKIPSLPEYKIDRLDLHDVPVDSGRKAIQADVAVTVRNEFPVGLDVPPLGFEVLVPNCHSKLPSISVADATTDMIRIRANQDVKAEAKGIIRDIPETLIRACPNSKSSPLDNFMDRYLHGEDARVYVRGKRSNDSETPGWISDILESITVPVEFPGRSFDNFIRNFSITDVDFKLPSPFADAKDPSNQPRVSGTTNVLAAIPPELNVNLAIESIRARADLFYEDRKLGELNLKHWEKANSTKLEDTDGDETLLNITSRVVDVPLTITDGDVFSEVIQKLLFGDEDIVMAAKADVDVRVATVLGILTVKNVPAEGKIPVNALPGNTFAKLSPQVGDIRVLNTSETGVHMQALVNITNPTRYTATIPYVSIHVLHDGEVLGEAITTDVDFELGNNTNILVRSTWDPVKFGGKNAHEIGRKLLSDYISGNNITLTAKAHRGSIPTVPLIGEALSKINFTLPAPRLKMPGKHGDTDQRFITSAVFHIFSSTATFGLFSPLQFNSLHIQHVDATAFYNHTEPVGKIVYSGDIQVPPGESETPRLPVQWYPDHLGYDKLRKALGGTLKLDAVADVTLRLGNWIETVHYTGKGIGAKVSL